jgi:hypothetical protein
MARFGSKQECLFLTGTARAFEFFKLFVNFVFKPDLLGNLTKINVVFGIRLKDP